MAHEEYKEMLVTHALSALDASEETSVKEHLATCAGCREELDHWRRFAAMMALSVEPVEPSPRVRERVLEAVQTERNRQALADEIATAQPTSGVITFSRPGQNLWTAMGSLGAIAAAIAVVSLFLSTAVLWWQKQAAQQELTQLSNEIQRTREQVKREREAVTLLTKPGARITNLSGTNLVPAARATLVYEKDGKALLFTEGLPPAPEGKAYQLWFIVGKQPLPGKVFTADASGNGNLWDQLPEAALAAAATFAVTLEPASGVQSPTGPMFLTSGS